MVKEQEPKSTEAKPKPQASELQPTEGQPAQNEYVRQRYPEAK